MTHHTCCCNLTPKTKIIVLVSVIVLLAAGLLGVKFYEKFENKNNKKTVILEPEAAKVKILDFINKNLVAAGTDVKITSLENANIDLYKVKVDITSQGKTQSIDSFMSRDGKFFYPEALNIEEIAAKNAAKPTETEQAEKPAAVVPKTDKPVVELFVMSHCPYGLQAEKGMIPAIEALGSAVDFKLKFVNYAMHGQKELNEQLNQYCINKLESAKLLSYVTCFANSNDGDSAACMKTAKINTAKVANCVKAADAEFKVTEGFNNNTAQFPPFSVHQADNVKYGVQGSPTLVINGVEADSNRDSASYLKTICNAFNKQPEACKKALSTTSPKAGFGVGEGAATDASCN